MGCRLMYMLIILDPHADDQEGEEFPYPVVLDAVQSIIGPFETPDDAEEAGKFIDARVNRPNWIYMIAKPKTFGDVQADWSQFLSDVAKDN
jgi:hypothetical protein